MKQFLIMSQRTTGTRKPVAIIDPARHEDFYRALKMAPELSLMEKAIIAVSLSGGLRVSEALSLKPCNYNPNTQRFTVKVLKKPQYVRNKKHEMIKAHEVNRVFQLHPVASELLQAYLKASPKKYLGYLFPVTRQYVFKKIKEIFGQHACPHSIARHSHITWLLHHRNRDVMSVSRLVAISPRIVESYNHINTEKELEEIYAEEEVA